MRITLLQSRMSNRKKRNDEGVRETLIPIESDGVPSHSLADTHRQALENVGEEIQHVNVDVRAFVNRVAELNTRKVSSALSPRFVCAQLRRQTVVVLHTLEITCTNRALSVQSATYCFVLAATA